MKHFLKLLPILALCACARNQNQKSMPLAGTPVEKVNVFLGTSGDYGQMSPAASSPFNMMSIGPQTNPHTHTGYEYLAREFLGFTHTRMEGVGCTGSGGNILIKPLLNKDLNTDLIKKEEKATPGNYQIRFKNGIEAQMGVSHNFGIHQYHFPGTQGAFLVDLSFALANRFVDENHTFSNHTISGWIDTKTTCGAGIYRLYYYIDFASVDSIQKIEDHKLLAIGSNLARNFEIRIGFSSVDTLQAKHSIRNISYPDLTQETTEEWEKVLSKIKVEGEKERVNLFYSLLYRTLQAPYLISEKEGTYRAIDGTVQHAEHDMYNGWAIWDNYREQIPLLSMMLPEKFGDIAKSIAQMYKFGKKDWATLHEPSPTVRTEHAMIVLLDAWEKGVNIDFGPIKDAILQEADNLDDHTPDKALESCYDNWALSEILLATGDTSLSKEYKHRALQYKSFWLKDFADLTKDDVDRMQARGLYQGTIWQYRWFVPFDIKGLKALTGGEENFIRQLDAFFNGDYYNHANQPDLQVPGLYNATHEPWKSQKLFRNLLLDTVVQYYFNNNSKGIDPYIGRIYKNQPKAYLRTMDDDAGTMSSWFALRSIGLSPANVGSPVFYLTAPIFKEVTLNWDNGKKLKITVKNYHKDQYYIQSVKLNGIPLERNWLTYPEIMDGGELIIETGKSPSLNWGTQNQWISSIGEQ